MTQPIPDRSEIALKYLNQFYIGTFERTSRFKVHFDPAGISLIIYPCGVTDQHNSVGMHFHYALFAEILSDLATSASLLRIENEPDRKTLCEAADAFCRALQDIDDPTAMTPDEAVLLLHIME